MEKKFVFAAVLLLVGLLSATIPRLMKRLDTEAEAEAFSEDDRAVYISALICIIAGIIWLFV